MYKVLCISFKKNSYSQICVSYSLEIETDKSKRIIKFAIFKNYE